MVIPAGDFTIRIETHGDYRSFADLDHGEPIPIETLAARLRQMGAGSVMLKSRRRKFNCQTGMTEEQNAEFLAVIEI